LLDDRIINVTSSEQKQDKNNDIIYETTDDLESELSEFRSKWKKELNEQQKHERNNEKMQRQETKVEIIHGRKVQETNDDIKDADDEFTDTSNEEKAEYLFKKGVMLEQQNQFYEAIKFYRMAMQFDENIEFKVASQKQIQHHRGDYRAEIEHEFETLGISDSTDVELSLLEQFQACILSERHGLCEKNFPQRSTHFSDLPIEVVMLILRWVVSDDLDVRSLEVISCVS
jgi:F-box protein 9